MMIVVIGQENNLREAHKIIKGGSNCNKKKSRTQCTKIPFLWGLGEIIVGCLTPNFFEEVDSQTRMHCLLLLMEGTCHCTKARLLVKMFKTVTLLLCFKCDLKFRYFYNLLFPNLIHYLLLKKKKKDPIIWCFFMGGHLSECIFEYKKSGHQRALLQLWQYR